MSLLNCLVLVQLGFESKKFSSKARCMFLVTSVLVVVTVVEVALWLFVVVEVVALEDVAV